MSEPTPEMIEVGMKLVLRNKLGERLTIYPRHIAAIYAAMQAVAPDGWEPIETAPKDGTKVLTYTPPPAPYGDPYFCVCAFFHGHWPSKWMHATGNTEPTHWMPLPAPPLPEGGVMSKLDEAPALQASRSVSELENDLAYYRDMAKAFGLAFRNWPRLPPPATLKMFAGTMWPDDYNRGNAMQRELGLDAIPPKTECECGAGFWDRITNGAWRTADLPDRSEAQPEANTNMEGEHS